MAQSLRDQLVAAGLASSSQAKKAEKQKRAEAQARAQNKKHSSKGKKRSSANKKTANKKGTAQPQPGSPQAAAAEPTVTARAKLAQAAKVRRDKEIARERNAKAQARAIRAQIKQLVTENDQRVKEKSDTDVPYNFLHKKKIKRIYVPPAQLDALSKGKLVIINNDGLYHLVTPEVAEKIAKRDPKWIITAHGDNKDANEPEMDDYYKKFEVPDDLDW